MASYERVYRQARRLAPRCANLPREHLLIKGTGERSGAEERLETASGPQPG